MSALHSDITDDRQYTQLAYEVGFYPWSRIREGGKRLVVYHRSTILWKWEVLQKLDENQLLLDDEFLVRWSYNNIPTKKEWDDLSDWSKVVVQYRISPAIKDNGGRVAIIVATNWIQDKTRKGNI